jgi:hypothetical protein
VYPAQRQFPRLPGGALRAAAQEHRDRDQVVAPVDFQPHRLVLNLNVARARFNRRTDGGLLANHERHRSKGREAATLGQPQPKLLDTGGHGGIFQQAADAADGDAQVGAIKAMQRKPCLFQHRLRVDACGSSNFRIMRQARTSDQIGHASTFNECP